jgi:threonine/homoserine/homoserine lactone efflux protein
MGGKLPLVGGSGPIPGDRSLGGRMPRNTLSCSTIVAPVVVASALFIGAILTRSFWLSLVLGVAGAGTFAYAVFLVREARKRLSDDRQLKSQGRTER